jgi:hypothetical protein
MNWTKTLVPAFRKTLAHLGIHSHKLLPLLLVLTLPAVVQAQDYTYTTNDDNTITITGYTEFIVDLNIPDTINGLPVTGIADLYFPAAGYVASIAIPAGVTNITPNAFSSVGALITVDSNNPAYSSLAGVLFNKDQTVLVHCPWRITGSYTIPSTVTNVGDSAFYYCENLTNIAIPNSVIRLGNSAFYACSSLPGITIPASVASIGTNVFYTTSVTGITVDPNNPAYSSLAGVLFNKDQTVLVQCPLGKTGSYTIPGTVTNLGDSAFFACLLTNITIPTNVTALGDNVFGSCYGLTSMIIPNSITSIGNSDFYFCQDLTNVTLPNTVTRIGDFAFGGCNDLVNLSIPPNLVSIGDSAFFACTGFTNFSIPDSATNIGANAFSECFSLTNITIPSGITRIEAGTFSFCENLATIAMPANLTSIGDSAFYYSGVTDFTIPDSVTNLGSSAFLDCTGLTNITIGNGVPCVASNTFGGCGSLTSVTIGTGVTSLGDSAFYDCEKLPSLVIPNSVTNIGASAFYACYSLTNITIGTGVISIGDFAFSSCYGLTDIALPDSLTSIGSSAFNGCYMTNISIPGHVASIGSTAFACPYLDAIIVNQTNSYYSSLDGVLFNKSQTTLIEYPGGRIGAYVMPNTVTNVGDYAFYYCENLTGISLSDKLTAIGSYAFNNCQSLTTITIPSGVNFIGDQAFGWSSLSKIYLLGNAPVIGSDLFLGDIYLANNNAYVYYLPGTTGWGATFGSLPLVLWNPQVQTGDGSFGVQANQFGFNITGNYNLVVVVEATSGLANPVWSPVSTNTLNTSVGTNGSAYFSDPDWTNFPGRFYRLRSP